MQIHLKSYLSRVLLATLVMLSLNIMASCNMHRSPIMTMDCYHEIHPGISEENLVKSYGKPQQIFQQENHILVYVYAERLVSGAESGSTLAIRYYYFVIKDGKVTAKYVRIRDRSPVFDMNDLVPNSMD